MILIGWILIGWILTRVDFDRVDFDLGGFWSGRFWLGWILIGWILTRVDFERGWILNAGGFWSRVDFDSVFNFCCRRNLFIWFKALKSLESWISDYQYPRKSSKMFYFFLIPVAGSLWDKQFMYNFRMDIRNM